MNTNSKRILRAYLTGAVALTLGLGPAIEPAHAVVGTTELTNLPIASKVSAKPNIIYTLDDSGSMTLNYLPDFVILNYCRNGTGLAACAGTNNFNYPPFLDSDWNHLAYNPNVTYTAPKKYDGTSYPDQNAANTTNWTKVYSDPYLPVGGPFPTSSLTPNVSVPVYCNSDWPLVGNPYIVGDVGDANGEAKPATYPNEGRDCRINGTDYSASPVSPIADDYNYPWGAPSVAPWTSKYYYRNGGTKVLWCDATAAGWPRSTTVGCAYTCTLSGVYTPPLPQVQTCNFTTNATQCCTGVGTPAGCASASTYTPAGCNTSVNPEYCSPGIGTPPECTAGCGCNSQVVGKNATCSITGVQCGCPSGGSGCTVVVNGNAACPNAAPAPTNANCSAGVLVKTCTGAAGSANCTDKIWDPVNLVYTTTTLQNDADLVNGGTGKVCRHNNFDYSSIGGPTASPVNYTSLPLNAIYKTTVSGGCPTYASSITIPRHYYTVASVDFCKNPVNAVANAQWKGFGLAASGCSPTHKNDFTTYVNPLYGKFTRVDLVNDGRVFSYVDPYTGLPGARSFALEMTNYANWYAYYRTRVLAAKTTTALAFSFLDATYRVGFHTLNTPSTNYVDVNDWNPGAGAQRDNWYKKLFGVTIGTGLTPSIDAILRVGELFRTGKGGQGALPTSSASVFPEGFIPAGATDPIVVSCQKNYHIYFTDGFTNQFSKVTKAMLGAIPGYADEVDGGNVPVLTDDPDFANHPEVTIGVLGSSHYAPMPGPPNFNTPLFTGKPWPDPYKDPIPTADTLADISLYYWMTDLRPAAGWPASIAIDNVPSNDGRDLLSLAWTGDPAFWQHVNLSAISFGSEGVLDATNTVNVTNSIAASTTKWFVAPNIPNPPNNPGFPALDKGATAVDDLWHATVNSRGTFVYAKDPIQVSYGLGHILAGIQNSRKSRAGSAFSSSVLTLTNHSIFEPTIEPGWAGDLKKVEIDPFTAKQTIVDWDALTILNTLLATPAIPPATDSLYPWFANRRIVSFNTASSTAVPFLFGNMSAGQLATLGGTAAIQQKSIAYLRGGSVAGAPTPSPFEGTAIGQFRQRFGKLGDISDSAPLVVPNPNCPPYTPTNPAPDWDDSNDWGYLGFVASICARAPRVYVGANDGMLHSFDTANGDEDFAYIPGALFNSLNDEDGAPRGIQALMYQDGGAPTFKHHFYVNGSPRTSDVDFNNCGGNSACAPDWHTIVVGSLAKGGASYFAIDATTPVLKTDTEAAIAAKVLWEFTAPDMVYSFSHPIIGKTRADGWVVIVANGYDSVSGKGKLYMINPKTGVLIRTLTTTAVDPGTPGSPSGLAQINGFTQDFHNQIIEQIYGGDLNGNVWRWDVSDPVVANWTTVLFAQLTDPSGGAQPVTTAPQIEIDLNNGNDRFVFVGTGRLLHQDDLLIPSPEQIETFYAIRDGSLTTPAIAGLPIQPRAAGPGQLRTANALTTAPLAGAIPNGWFMDLPLGQRVVVDPEADLNVVTFIATSTQPDPCLTSLPAALYAREFVTAESDIQDQLTGLVVPSAFSAQGAVGLELVALLSAASSFPVLSIVITQETNAAVAPYLLQPKSFGGAHRMSWRMLGN